MSISVVLHTFNESNLIEECLKTVTWADEIVIIDMESTDDTVEKCRMYTEHIVTHPWLPTADSARPFGILQCTCDWVLALDPDERVSNELRDRIQALTKKTDADGYIIQFATWMFGREIKYTGWGGDKHLRLFKREKVSYPGHVHLEAVVDGSVRELDRNDGVIVHENYRSISQFVDKMNRYTSLEANRIFEEGRPFHWLKVFYQPMKSFYSRYIKCKGYKDGIYGLILSVLMAFYWQLTYLKLWEFYRNREKRASKTSV